MRREKLRGAVVNIDVGWGPGAGYFFVTLMGCHRV
jgi:hypothetical protein